MTALAHDFPSTAWVDAYGAAINASEDYRTASTEWTHGSVALVCYEMFEGIERQIRVGMWKRIASYFYSVIAQQYINIRNTLISRRFKNH